MLCAATALPITSISKAQPRVLPRTSVRAVPHASHWHRVGRRLTVLDCNLGYIDLEQKTRPRLRYRLCCCMSALVPRAPLSGVHHSCCDRHRHWNCGFGRPEFGWQRPDDNGGDSRSAQREVRPRLAGVGNRCAGGRARQLDAGRLRRNLSVASEAILRS